jgi:D-threonate/D-erythronate kinase
MSPDRLTALVVADDLTGAADTVTRFAEAGHRTHIHFDTVRAGVPASGVLAVDTDTRRSSPGEAARRVAGAVRAAPPARHYVKKIDSTLRGNVLAELAAMRDATGRRLIICAPAFPATGRITRDGVQWAGGVPVGDLTHLLAPLRPGRISLAELRGDGMAARLATADRAVVVDTEDDGDLRRLVQAGLLLADRLLWAGTGGLGAALAAALPAVGGAAGPPAPVAGPVLVVVGSTTAAAAAQAAAVGATGARTVTFPAGALLAGHSLLQARGQEVARALDQGKDVLVTIGTDTDIPAGHGRALLSALAPALAEAGPRPHALVITGGETARVLTQALGATGVRPVGQLEPGVVRADLIGALTCPVVTKSGAFGDAGSLVRALRALRAPIATSRKGTPCH